MITEKMFFPEIVPEVQSTRHFAVSFAREKPKRNPSANDGRSSPGNGETRNVREYLRMTSEMIQSATYLLFG